MSRRDFLRKAALTAAGAGFAPALLGSASRHIEILQAPRREPARPVGPNDRIRLGLIGAGIIGFIDTETALLVPGVELVAAADLYDARLRRVQERFGQHVATTRDYREILARPDVDAVIVATPDHWHARIAIDAMEAGKAVYLEKPMVQTIEEGPAVIAAQQRTKAVLQVGSQHASSILFDKIRELYRAGAIGEINQVEAATNRNSAIGAWQYSLPPNVTEAEIDWDRFLGHAPKVPFDPVRFFRWRNYRDYSTGVAGDLFVHLFTSIHTVLDAVGPTDVVGMGGLRFWKDGRDVPDVTLGLYDYPETEHHKPFTVALQSNFADGRGGSSYFRFIGSEGAITVSSNSFTLSKSHRREPSLESLVEGYNSVRTWSEDVRNAFVEEYRRTHPAIPTAPPMDVEQEYREPPGYNAQYDHFTYFFESVREGKPVYEDAVFGYRAAAPSLLSNLSLWEKKLYRWDPVEMKVVA